MISQQDIKKVVKTIVDNINPEKVIIFGSYASGNPDPDSDLDILVIKDMDIPRHKRSKEVKKHLRGLKIPVDLIVYSPEEIEEWKDTRHAFISKAIEEGKVVHG